MTNWEAFAKSIQIEINARKWDIKMPNWTRIEQIEWIKEEFK